MAKQKSEETLIKEALQNEKNEMAIDYEPTGVRLQDLYGTDNNDNPPLTNTERRKQLHPELAAEASIGGLDMLGMSYATPDRLSQFGRSKYDKSAALYETTPERMAEVRAMSQSGTEKIFHGAIKGITTTGTTFANTLIGIPIGTINLIANGSLKGDWSLRNAWDNPFTRTTKNIDESMESMFPNYYSEEEMNTPWYNNIFSANSIGDKLLKNFGFTFGSMAAVKLIGKIPFKPLSKIIGNIARAEKGTNAGIRASRATNAITSSMVGAVGESSFEALTNSSDFAKYKQADIDNWYDESVNEINDRFNKQAFEIQMSGDPYAEEYISALQESYAKEISALNQEKRKRQDALSAAVAKYGNTDFLANIAILSLTNIGTTKTLLEGGFKDSRGSLGQWIEGDLSRENLRMAGTPGIESKVKLTRKGLTRQEVPTTNNIYRSRLTKAENIGRYLGSSLIEGVEEISQLWASNASKGYANDFYEMSINPEQTDKTANYFYNLVNEYAKTLGDINSWEEFTLGFISGGISKAIMGEAKQLRKERKDVESAVDHLNNIFNNFSMQSAIKAMNRRELLEDQKLQAAILGDKKTFKDAEFAELASAVTHLGEVDRLSDLKDIVDYIFDEKLTDEELEKMAEDLSQKNKNGEELNSFVKKTNDQRREEIRKQRDKYDKLISEYTKTREELSNLSGGAFSAEQMSELVYRRLIAKNATERVNELIKQKDGLFKDKTKLKTLLLDKGLTPEQLISRQLKSIQNARKEIEELGTKIGWASESLQNEFTEETPNRDLVETESLLTAIKQHEDHITKTLDEIKEERKTFKENDQFTEKYIDELEKLNNLITRLDTITANHLSSSNLPQFAKSYMTMAMMQEGLLQAYNQVGMDITDENFLNFKKINNDIIALLSDINLYETTFADFVAHPEKIDEKNNKIKKQIKNLQAKLNAKLQEKKFKDVKSYDDFKNLLNNFTEDVKKELLNSFVKSEDDLLKDFAERYKETEEMKENFLYPFNVKSDESKTEEEDSEEEEDENEEAEERLETNISLTDDNNITKKIRSDISDIVERSYDKNNDDFIENTYNNILQYLAQRSDEDLSELEDAYLSDYAEKIKGIYDQLSKKPNTSSSLFSGTSTEEEEQEEGQEEEQESKQSGKIPNSSSKIPSETRDKIVKKYKSLDDIYDHLNDIEDVKSFVKEFNLEKLVEEQLDIDDFNNASDDEIAAVPDILNTIGIDESIFNDDSSKRQPEDKEDDELSEEEDDNEEEEEEENDDEEDDTKGKKEEKEKKEKKDTKSPKKIKKTLRKIKGKIIQPASAESSRDKKSYEGTISVNEITSKYDVNQLKNHRKRVVKDIWDKNILGYYHAQEFIDDGELRRMIDMYYDETDKYPKVYFTGYMMPTRDGKHYRKSIIALVELPKSYTLPNKYANVYKDETTGKTITSLGIKIGNKRYMPLGEVSLTKSSNLKFIKKYSKYNNKNLTLSSIGSKLITSELGWIFSGRFSSDNNLRYLTELEDIKDKSIETKPKQGEDGDFAIDIMKIGGEHSYKSNGKIDEDRIIELNEFRQTPNSKKSEDPRSGTVWILSKEADGRFYRKGVVIESFSKQWLQNNRKQKQYYGYTIDKALDELIKLAKDKNSKKLDINSVLSRLHKLLYFHSNAIEVQNGKIKINYIENRGAKTVEVKPEKDELIDAIEHYLHPHFTIDINDKNITLEDIVNSNILKTNLTHVKNCNASILINDVKYDGGNLEVVESATIKALQKEEKIHLGNVVKDTTKDKQISSIGGKKAAVITTDEEGNIHVYNDQNKEIKDEKEAVYHYINANWSDIIARWQLQEKKKVSFTDLEDQYGVTFRPAQWFLLKINSKMKQLNAIKIEGSDNSNIKTHYMYVGNNGFVEISDDTDINNIDKIIKLVGVASRQKDGLTSKQLENAQRLIDNLSKKYPSLFSSDKQDVGKEFLSKVDGAYYNNKGMWDGTIGTKGYSLGAEIEDDDLVKLLEEYYKLQKENKDTRSVSKEIGKKSKFYGVTMRNFKISKRNNNKIIILTEPDFVDYNTLNTTKRDAYIQELEKYGDKYKDLLERLRKANTNSELNEIIREYNNITINVKTPKKQPQTVTPKQTGTTSTNENNNPTGGLVKKPKGGKSNDSQQPTGQQPKQQPKWGDGVVDGILGEYQQQGGLENGNNKLFEDCPI